MSSRKVLLYDRWIIIPMLALMAYGLLMVTSSSMVISDRQYDYPFYFLIRQAIYLGLGLIAAFIVLRIPLSTWQRLRGQLIIGALILLILVLIPGIGHVVNGSRRWLGLGPLTLQVSEFAKFALVIYLAGYLVAQEQAVQTKFSGFAKPLIIMGIIAVLLILEPDFGTTVVIACTAMVMLFMGGVRVWHFLILLAIVGIALGVLAMSSPYRVERLTTFTNPWANQFSSGYQLTQSLIAFGRGGLLGVGLGNSVQKLFYLPEAHTDFLFAVLGEELGLAGELLLTVLFVLLIGRGFYLAKTALRAHKPFGAYLCYGISTWLGLQAMINMGVDMGLLPTKGLTLPLISYGGSSTVINCIAIALMLRVSHEIFQQAGNGTPTQQKTRSPRGNPLAMTK